MANRIQLFGSQALFTENKEDLLSGILCDGVLLWMICQLDTTPENLVILQAVSHYSDTEVTTAKKALYTMSGHYGTVRDIIVKEQ